MCCKSLKGKCSKQCSQMYLSMQHPHLPQPTTPVHIFSGVHMGDYLMKHLEKYWHKPYIEIPEKRTQFFCISYYLEEIAKISFWQEFCRWDLKTCRIERENRLSCSGHSIIYQSESLQPIRLKPQCIHPGKLATVNTQCVMGSKEDQEAVKTSAKIMLLKNVFNFLGKLRLLFQPQICCDIDYSIGVPGGNPSSSVLCKYWAHWSKTKWRKPQGQQGSKWHTVWPQKLLPLRSLQWSSSFESQICPYNPAHVLVLGLLKLFLGQHVIVYL